MAKLQRAKAGLHFDEGHSDIGINNGTITGSGNSQQELTRVKHSFEGEAFNREITLSYDPQIHVVSKMLLRIELAGGTAGSFWTPSLGDIIIKHIRQYYNGEDYLNFTNTKFHAWWAWRTESRELALSMDEVRLRNKTDAERDISLTHVLWIDLTQVFFWFGQKQLPDGTIDNTYNRITVGNAGRQSLRITLRPLTELLVNSAGYAGATPTIDMQLFEEGYNLEASVAKELFDSHYLGKPDPLFDQSTPGVVVAHETFRTYQEFTVTQLTGVNRFVLDNFNGKVRGYLICFEDPANNGSTATDYNYRWDQFVRPAKLKVEYGNVEIWHERDQDQLRYVEYPRLFPR